MKYKRHVSYVLVTHNDGDGAGCSILFHKAFRHKDKKVYYCNYKNVDKVVTDLAYSRDEIVLYIADISIREETAELLIERGIDVLLIDHHKSAEKLKKYAFAIVEDGCCGARLLYEYILNNLHKFYVDVEELKRYEPFIDLINDHDLWLHKNKKSERLNDLFKVMGIDRFVDRFDNNPFVEFSEGEVLLMEIERDKMNRYVSEAIKHTHYGIDGNGNHYALVYAETYHSQIGNDIVYGNHDIDYCVIINSKDGIVGLRSRGFDVLQIAEGFGGGGHPRSGGFTIKDKRLAKFGHELLNAF